MGDVEEDPVQFMEELSKEESARLMEEEVSHQEGESHKAAQQEVKKQGEAAKKGPEQFMRP